MTYFSNGSEGDGYIERYCEKCLNYGEEEDPQCPILAVHLMFNYDQLEKGQEKLRECLSALIPTDDKGFGGECRMFRPIGGDAHTGFLFERTKQRA